MTGLTNRKTLVASAEAAAVLQIETGVEQHNPWSEVSDNGVVWREAFEQKLASTEIEASV